VKRLILLILLICLSGCASLHKVDFGEVYLKTVMWPTEQMVYGLSKIPK